jgi:hypothetical protein
MIACGFLAYHEQNIAIVIFPLVSIMSMAVLNRRAVSLMRAKEVNFSSSVGGETIQAFGNICFVLAFPIILAGIWGNYTHYKLDVTLWNLGVVVAPLFEGVISIGFSTFLSNDVRQTGVLLGEGRDTSVSSAEPSTRHPGPISMGPMPDFSNTIRAIERLETAINNTTAKVNNFGGQFDGLAKTMTGFKTLIEQVETLISSINSFINTGTRRDGIRR